MAATTLTIHPHRFFLTTAKIRDWGLFYDATNDNGTLLSIPRG